MATTLSKFADDSKTRKAVNNAEDHQHLQEDLDNLVKWAKDWQMSFNPSKCKVYTLIKTISIKCIQWGASSAETILESTMAKRRI